MRNPNRIDEILSVVGDIWHANPDWRFGQLMSNVLGEISKNHNLYDIFFPEDGEWLKWLKEYKESHSIYNYGQNLKLDPEVDDGK